MRFPASAACETNISPAAIRMQWMARNMATPQGSTIGRALGRTGSWLDFVKPLFRLLGRIDGGLGHAPRIVFFLGVGNSFERRLVGLVVDLLGGRVVLL